MNGRQYITNRKINTLSFFCWLQNPNPLNFFFNLIKFFFSGYPQPSLEAWLIPNPDLFWSDSFESSIRVRDSTQNPPVNHRCKGRWTTPTFPTKTWHKLQTTTSAERTKTRRGGPSVYSRAEPTPKTLSPRSQKFLEAEGRKTSQFSAWERSCRRERTVTVPHSLGWPHLMRDRITTHQHGATLCFSFNWRLRHVQRPHMLHYCQSISSLTVSW